MAVLSHTHRREGPPMVECPAAGADEMEPVYVLPEDYPMGNVSHVDLPDNPAATGTEVPHTLAHLTTR
jgi:hypothetical protein